MPIQLFEVKSGVIPPAYLIPASEGDEKPGILWVRPASFFTYIDADRGSLRSVALSDQVAKAICDDFASSQLGIDENSRPGVTWFPGKLEAEEVLAAYPKEIAQVLDLHYNWYRAICFIADNDWNRYHHHNSVSDIQRKAGTALGLSSLEHEWLSISSAQGQTRCPACKSPLHPDAIVCGACKCIVDAERYKKLSFAKEEPWLTQQRAPLSQPS